MKNYKNKKILVVGLGRSGLAAAEYLALKGALVTVTDTRSEIELSETKRRLEKYNIEYHFGLNPADLFKSTELVVLSPGVPLEIEGVKKAKEAGIPVVCELELGLGLLKGKVIGVTGTNGKSTVTALIGEMLEGSWVGGNIGRPLIGDIEAASVAPYVVLELSSYQLLLTPSLRANIALWLNVTPDHLDRYGSFRQYIEAKKEIGKNQLSDGVMIYNADDKIVSESVAKFASQKVPFSISRKLEHGASYEAGRLMLKFKDKSLSIDVSASPLRGIHNKENIAAASLAALVAGAGSKEIEGGLKSFKGLPHRLQFVAEAGGVSYYNDSKGTNAGAAAMSVKSFDVPVVLIAGGQDKNTGYAELKAAASGLKAIIVIGEAAEKIEAELGGSVEVVRQNSLEEAVKCASRLALPGDVVLLSPACASFDMFKDYAHRGDVFVECVRNINNV